MGSNPEPHPLPYWQVNISPERRQAECPGFLRNISAKDMGIIGSRDEDYHIQTWGDVVDIVRSNRLADFQRWPSDLRRYREYIWHLKRDFGSVMNFMLKERLHWPEPIIPQARRPFESEGDFKILMNDWPYGIDNRIVHLVVWTKFELEDNAETEAAIDQFVETTFAPGVARDKVIWFKNPPSLKSVHSVEHIHVMLFNPDADFVRKITNGDVPRSQLLNGVNCHRR